MTIESWEDALLSVSATLKRHEDSNTVQDLEGFLVGTFEHRLARAVVKEKSIKLVIEYRASEEALEGIKSARMEDWVPISRRRYSGRGTIAPHGRLDEKKSSWK